jgi:circadian clock protein KaiC
MHIGRPFRQVTGILSGNPIHIAPGEIDRMNQLFNDDEPQT